MARESAQKKVPLPFTSTLFTPTGVASTLTFYKLHTVHHILRADGLMGLRFWLARGINHNILMSRVVANT